MKVSPLLWGAVGGVAIVLALAPMLGGSLTDLTRARTDASIARASAAASASATVARPLLVPATSRDAANAAIVARLRALAGRGAVLVEEARPIDDRAGLTRIAVRLSGSEDAVIAVVDTIERGVPLARFARWRIEAAGGAIRLQGEVVAPWR